MPVTPKMTAQLSVKQTIWNLVTLENKGQVRRQDCFSNVNKYQKDDFLLNQRQVDSFHCVFYVKVKQLFHKLTYFIQNVVENPYKHPC